MRLPAETPSSRALTTITASSTSADGDLDALAQLEQIHHLLTECNELATERSAFLIPGTDLRAVKSTLSSFKSSLLYQKALVLPPAKQLAPNLSSARETERA
jgi:hypothetical protein